MLWFQQIHIDLCLDNSSYHTESHLIIIYYFLDKLIKNLVTDAIELDKKENLNKAPSQRTDYHLQSLVKCISSCGVSFSVWEKTDADGKGSGLHDFTSLMGADKKLILKSLPEKLSTVIRPEISDTVVKIWKVQACINVIILSRPASLSVQINLTILRSKCFRLQVF